MEKVVFKIKFTKIIIKVIVNIYNKRSINVFKQPSLKKVVSTKTFNLIA